MNRNSGISAMYTFDDDSSTEDEIWESDNEGQSSKESTNSQKEIAKSENVIREAEVRSNSHVDVCDKVVESKHSNNRKPAPKGYCLPEVPNQDFSSDDDFWDQGAERSRTPAVKPSYSTQTSVKTVVPSQISKAEAKHGEVESCPDNKGSSDTEDGDWDPRKDEYFHTNNIYGLNPNSASYVTQNYEMQNEFKICKYYMTRAGCRKGNHCNFKHVNPAEQLYLDKEEILLELLPRENFAIGSYVLIEIMALQSPDSFYGIPLNFVSFHKPDKIALELLLESSVDNSPQLTQLLQLSEEMSKHYSLPTTRKNYETIPSPGSLVAFKDSTIYFRGRVLGNGIDDDTLDIQCLDTGEMYESFSRTNVFPLVYKFAMTPAFAVHFRLANVMPHPNGWSSKFLKMFEDLLYRKTFVAQILNEHSFTDAIDVELFTLHDSDEINVSEWLRNNNSAINLNDGCVSENENMFSEPENVTNEERANQNNHSHETQNSFHSCDAETDHEETNITTTSEQNYDLVDNREGIDENGTYEPTGAFSQDNTLLDSILNESTGNAIHRSTSTMRSPIDGYINFDEPTSSTVVNEPLEVPVLSELSRSELRKDPRTSKEYLNDHNNGHFSDNLESHAVNDHACNAGLMDMSLETSFDEALVDSTFYSFKSGCEDQRVGGKDDVSNATVVEVSKQPEVNSINGYNFVDENCQENGCSNLLEEEQCHSVSEESHVSMRSLNRRRPRIRRRRVPLVVREIRNLTDAIYQLSISLQKNQ